METKYLIGKDSPITRLSKTFPRNIDENLTLGLDIGIGSLGQAIVSLDRPYGTPLGSLPVFFDEDHPSHIRYLGVRAFDVPEKPTETGKITLKNPERRQKRLLRRVIKRRAQRMRQVRALLKKEGVLPASYSLDDPEWRSRHERATPWLWRKEGLDRKLEDWEWASCLLHFAKHRGFKSNKKSDLSSTGKDGGSIQSSRANHEALKQYRSVAEMMLSDPRFRQRIRNTARNYQSMVLRADLEVEIKTLFAQQRKFGNPHASEALENAFLEIFHRQRSMQDPYLLLGDCPFEKDEKRGSRFSYSFELARVLQKLNTLSVLTSEGRVYLKDLPSAQEGIQRLIKSFGDSKKITWKDLRKFFDLADDIRFLDLSVAPKKGKEEKDADLEKARLEAEKSDFATKSGKYTSAYGSNTLRQVLGDSLWNELVEKDPASLDNAAFVLTFFENPETILSILRGNPPKELLKNSNSGSRFLCYKVDPRVADAVAADYESASPKLLNFSGSVSLSEKACRNLIPFLAQGMVYSDACAAAGYRHTDSNYVLNSIMNPVVKSVLRETMKQVVHLIDQAGALPGSICVELGRDLGKSMDERNDISWENHRRTEEKKEYRRKLVEEHNVPAEAITDEVLLRYELWNEQNGYCPYCGEYLAEVRLCLEGAEFQVDHILPRSRSHDNSYNNRVLVHATCNKAKGNCTPAEWLRATENTKAWQRFQATLRLMPSMKPVKKRNYLLNTTFSDPDEADKFLSRNLNDTRYIAKVVLEYLKDLYRLAGEEPDAAGTKRRIFAQPGALTALVRKAWGLNDLKKDVDGNRIGDKHHAVDALVCACLSEGQRQIITRSEQLKRNPFGSIFERVREAYTLMEQQHPGRLTPLRVAPPWPTLREDTIRALDQLNVSRRERRNGTGPFHDETFYRRGAINKKGVPDYFIRESLVSRGKGKSVALLKSKKDLECVKGINEPQNKWLRKALTEWIDQGSPVDALPCDPQGMPIRKITYNVGSKAARPTPHGYVIGGQQVCLDVFSKTKKAKLTKGTDTPKAEKTYYLVPVYTYHIRNEAPPMKAITANKPEEQWETIDETFTYEFTLWRNSLFEVKKEPSAEHPEGEYIRGYYRGVDRSNGKIEFRDINDSAIDGHCTVKQKCLVFRKLSIDRLGRITPVQREKRVWRGKVYTSAAQPT